MLLARRRALPAILNRRRLFLLRQLNMLVALSGMLGFITGVIKTFTNMPTDQLYIAFIGVGESLNNVALALALDGARAHHQSRSARARDTVRRAS